MPSLKRLSHRFRTRALHEVAGEIIRLLTYRLDHLAYRFGTGRIVKKISKTTALLQGPADKLFPNIFPGPDQFRHFGEVTGEGQKQEIIAEAENFMLRRFDILGSGPVTLDPIDWHLDFKSGHRWAPGRFFLEYNQENVTGSADVKVPRELCRSHHMVRLGEAYLLTRDERYAKEIVDGITEWITQNRLMHSINWGCTMDVAIRAVNWTWALGMIRSSNSLTEKIFREITASLYEHGWFIFRHPENGEVNRHNHYLADLSGQIHLGLLFRELPEPRRWLEEGIKNLYAEIRRQILPSGISYERSTNYNRLVLELILVPVLLAKQQGYEVPMDIWYRLETMFGFILSSLKPDGTTPIIGDQDDGRLLPFGTEGNTDFRYLLSLGSILFNRPDLKAHGNGFNPYCFFLGGTDAAGHYSRLDPSEEYPVSKAFPDAGFYILRNENDYLFFNASGKGLYPEIPSGTHTHSDLLSFELFTNGRTWLTDAGSYLYTADPAQRLLFRSTVMHNTVTVDGLSQNILKEKEYWNFERNAIPKLISWNAGGEVESVAASHTGYQRLPDPVTHQRTIEFNKKEHGWKVTDELKCAAVHNFEWNFHFSPDIDIFCGENYVSASDAEKRQLIITFQSPELFSLVKKPSFISGQYGRKEPSFMLSVVMGQAISPTMIFEIN